MSGVNEIVIVAAKERRLFLGRHHQPHIGVAFEAVQPILAAAVERNDLAAESSRAVLLDCGDLGGTFRRGLARGRARRRGVVDALGNIIV